MRIFRML